MGTHGDRISVEQWASGLALLTAERATCCRRKVGCILLNSKTHVIGTGFNGPPAKMPHCNPAMCPGASSLSGTNLDGCAAIHAEQNALLQCKDIYEIDTCYVTTAPCMTCTKLLLNTSCKRIVFCSDYPSSGRSLWELAGRVWEKLNELHKGEEDKDYGRDKEKIQHDSEGDK